MKRFTSLDGIALFIILMPIICLIWAYPFFPESIPMHYGINGTPDRYENRSEFIKLQAIPLLIGAVTYLILKFRRESGRASQQLGFVLILFFATLNIFLIL